MGRITFKNLMFILSIVIVIINSQIVKSSVQLSPNTSSSGICPQVTFNCTAVDLPSTTLRWFINDDTIAAYPYIPTHQFPYNETPVSSPWREVVMIQIMNASYSESNRDSGNFYSTLTANLSALVILGGNDISCGSTGTKSAIALNFQYIVPLIPEITIFTAYNNENQLSQLTVTWQVKLMSDVCSFDNSLNYTIFLNDSRGGRLEEMVVNSDSCDNNLCSTTFNILSSNQSYRVSIYAANAFGQSNTAESVAIENSLQMEVLNPILTFEDCVTTLLCSSILAEGPCIIQYGWDSSYENFDNHLNVSLNSSSPLPLMDALTQYYFQVEVRVNSTIYISRRSFMTGEFAVRLTDANIGLLIIGIFFLILGILIFLVWIPLFQKCDRASDKHVWIVLSLVILPIFLWLVSVCLWIAVGGVVGPQINTCDSKWQSNRNNLIIAAFVLSFISLLLFITATAVTIYKKPNSKKKMDDNKIELEEQKNTLDQKFGNDKPSQEPASKCQQCGSEFSYFPWNRPHYCGACGKCFCSLCTVNEANLPYDLTMKQKVCDSCYIKCGGKDGIQVYGPGPSRFYQPTSSQPAPVTQQAASSQTVTSTENGSTTKLLTKDDTSEGFIMVEKDGQKQKIDGSGGKPTQITEQETSHARDHSNLTGIGTKKGSDGNQDGTTKQQPQQKNKDKELGDGVSKRLLEVYQEKTPKKEGTPEEFVIIEKDSQNQKVNGSGGKPPQITEQNKGAALDHKEPQQNSNEGVLQDPGNECRELIQDEPGLLDKVKARVAGAIDHMFSEAPKETSHDPPNSTDVTNIPDDSHSKTETQNETTEKPPKKMSHDPPNLTDVTNTEVEATQSGTTEEDEPGIFDKVKAGVIDFFSGPKDERPDESGREERRDQGIIDKQKETSQDPPNPTDVTNTDYEATQNGTAEEDERPDESGNQKQTTLGVLIDKVKIMLPGSGNKSETPKETSADSPNPEFINDPDTFRELDSHPETKTQNGITEKSHEDEGPNESGNQEEQNQGLLGGLFKLFTGSSSRSEVPQEDHPHLMDSSTGTITETGPDFTPDNQDGKSEQPITGKKFATEKPTWNPDTEVCEVCQKNPIGMGKRHHCRACGKCVCSPCSRNEAYLPYEPKKAQRVCYLCYDICKNQGIKIVANTVTEEYETEEEVPRDPPSFESTGSGPARSDESKQPQKDGGPKESENQEQKIQGRSGNTSKETPHDTNQVEVTDTRSVANSQNEKSQQETTVTPVSFGAEAPELDIHSPNVCHACKKKVTSREYCRACGKVVCEKCSKKEAYLQYYANTVMVCPKCHKESKKKDNSSKEETTV